VTLSPELLTSNLLSPVVLAFVLGLVARALRSDLSIPPAIQSYLSIFLLLAIGLKGGVALRNTALADLAVLLAVTVVAGLVVALEIPAILLGLTLAKRDAGLPWHSVREVLVGKTALLLIGGMAIGALAHAEGTAAVNLMYGQLFQGTLMLFMLDMGMVAAGQLRGLGRDAFRLVVYGVTLPLVHGLVGTVLGHLAGLSPAGAAVFGTMTASASYIAAPASVRASLPEANVGRCITAALGITFPFNLALGIPVYFAVATALAS
jgi:hypothetical protein